MRIIDNGWIGIHEGVIRTIEATAPDSPPPTAPMTIDANGGIVMPGLVNTHTHLPMTLFRGLADDLPLIDWLNDHIFPAEARFIAPETVRWGTLLACAEMLLSGTTTCCDGYFLRRRRGPGCGSNRSAGRAGPGCHRLSGPGRAGSGDKTSATPGILHSAGRRSRLIRRRSSAMHPTPAATTPLRRPRLPPMTWALLFQVHVAETRSSAINPVAETRPQPVAHLDRLGVLDRRTVLAPCVWVDEATSPASPARLRRSHTARRAT